MATPGVGDQSPMCGTSPACEELEPSFGWYFTSPHVVVAHMSENGRLRPPTPFAGSLFGAIWERAEEGTLEGGLVLGIGGVD